MCDYKLYINSEKEQESLYFGRWFSKDGKMEVKNWSDAYAGWKILGRMWCVVRNEYLSKIITMDMY